MPQETVISLKNVNFQFGSKTVLQNLNLDISPGKIYCLVGSSGSGKTTCLRLMNGLLKPSSGEVRLDDKTFDYSKAEKIRRSMGYSIQGSGLFPHMNLFENLSIIARKEKMARKDIDKRIGELCELMSLPSDQKFLLKKPRQISGGQQQRVGIARALFMKPKVMLMDEPFSALDPITRSEIQKEFLRLQEKLGLTIVLVTHDLPEAFSMGHELVLLNQGRIEQKAKPSKFLLSPASSYVEEFMLSNSPGNVLKEVFLYSVVNSNVYSSYKSENGFEISHLDNSDTKKFNSEEKMKAFLNDEGQNYIYWTNPDGSFENYQEFDSTKTYKKHDESLKGTAHILKGMTELLKTKASTLPVTNEKGQLIGVFSQEALNAL